MKFKRAYVHILHIGSFSYLLFFNHQQHTLRTKAILGLV